MLAHEIRKHIANLLKESISLEEFEDWFLPATWNTVASNSESSRLAGEVMLLLAEHDRGDRNDIDLKEAFRDILARRSSVRSRP